MNYPQGSEWRKWDLHVHTPASIVHNYGGTEAEAWEKFIADLETLPSEFKVIGINDYLFLDGYKKVREAKANGRLANIDLILPVIELRLDKFGGTDSHLRRINYHVIFDELDPELIQAQFLNSLTRGFTLSPEYAELQNRWTALPTRASLEDLGKMIIDSVPTERRHQYGTPLKEGFNNFNVSLDTIKAALNSHYFSGRHLTAVGKTEWAAIKWNDASIAEKKNIINDANLVFLSAKTVTAFHEASKSLRDNKVNYKLFDCSDAHNYSTAQEKDRIGKCFTWIKADTTFAGLQHAIREYDKRVFVGDEPEKLVRVRTNKTKYIDSIEIKKVSGSTFPETWFNCTIPLNKDLVAIIGNKGSGKSALADTLGLLGNTRQGDHFSFLNTSKFRDPRNNKAQYFDAHLMWASGAVAIKNLDDLPSLDDVETIKYLPQFYIETICNELTTSGNSAFDRELKKIIFKHVAVSDRLGRDSLDEVLAYKTQETNTTIRVLSDELHQLNVEIIAREEKSTDTHRIQLESQLRLKQDELATHEKAKPKPVPEPARSEEAKQAFAKIGDEITKKKSELGRLDTTIKDLDKKRADLVRKGTIIDKALGKIDNFRRQFEEFKRALAADLADLDLMPPLTFETIVSLKVERQKLNSLRSEYRGEVDKIDLQLDGSKQDSLVAMQQKLQREIQQLQDSLDEPNRKYVAYQTSHEEWTKRKTIIIGDLETPNSIKWLERRLADLKNLPNEIAILRKQREGKTREIYRETVKLADAYRLLYKPVQDFIDGQKIASEKIPLNFEVTIAEEGFQQNFLERINRQVRGTFSGVEDSDSLLRQLLQSVDFNSEGSVIAFVNEVHDSLHTDKRSGAAQGNVLKVSDQLRKGETVGLIYDFIFPLSFLVPRYTLKYGGHEIHQLSPGERGLLLLVFYLLIDKDDIPLVIDQPEENLDNQTIYEVLVNCLADVKRRRQVIVVTHNPNLAVVCDAEQVIYAYRDKATNSIFYSTGAIENAAMNKHVIDVLEGTRPAFNNRDSKYFA